MQFQWKLPAGLRKGPGSKARSLCLGLVSFLGAALLGGIMVDFPAATVRAVADYTLRLDLPKQTIEGLGMEIQSDSISSGNNGLPTATTSVPHDLVASERTRFYNDMLKGFRYVRLAMGLYLRGLDTAQQHIIERFSGQMDELAEMIQQSGIDGADVEYWSPAPYWKSNNSYIQGTLKQYDSTFLNRFGDALVQDVNYLQAHGVPVVQWGLQKEPSVCGVQYSSNCYTSQQYYDTFKVVAPKIRTNFPSVFIHANSEGGQNGVGGSLIRGDSATLGLVDSWTWHKIGSSSNEQITSNYNSNAMGKPVFNNEFEYLDGPASPDRFINTAQSLMNWMTFQDSPTWYWLHALKPTCNSEASGYSLGFWQPADTSVCPGASTIQPGHWDYNRLNFHSVAGFLNYMPWNSVRYQVDEATVRNDNRIMAWKTPQGQVVFALTNRSSTTPFTFNIDVAGTRTFSGYRYTATEANLGLGVVRSATINPTLPPQSIEFWVETPNAIPGTSPDPASMPPASNAVIVDNGQTGYQETGAWVASNLTGYNGSSTRYSTTNGSTAKWTPNLPNARAYQVYAWYPYYATNSTAATYTINYNGGSAPVTKNQTQQTDGWALVGAFNFAAGTGGSVTLTVSGGTTHRADAVRFVPAPLLSDNFEGTSTSLQPVTGSWTVKGDGSQGFVYQQTSTAATSNRAYANIGGWTNYAVQAKVRIVSTGADSGSSAAGVIARYADDNNFYSFRLNQLNGKAELYKRVGGTFYLLSSVSTGIAPGGWYTLKLEVNGASLKGFVNGTQLIAVTDSSIASGKAGFQGYSAQVSFDDLVVSSL